MERIPFNLEKAKKGEKVVAWNGAPVRILCFDRNAYHPIVALVTNPTTNAEEVYCFQLSGVANDSSTRLYMQEERPVGYIPAQTQKICRTCKYRLRNALNTPVCTYTKPPLRVTLFDTCKKWEMTQ